MSRADSVARLLESLAADLPDPVRMIDRDGCVLYRNAAALAFPPEGLGHLCANEISGGPGSCPACRLEELYRRGASQRWHVVVPRDDLPGARAYYEVTLAAVRDDDGSVCCAVEMLRDETANLGLQHYLMGESEEQQNESRRQSEQTRKLESELGNLRDEQTDVLFRDRVSAMGQVAASMSHEIHTPLGALLSSADLLQRTLEKTARQIDEQGDAFDVAAFRRKLGALISSADVIGEGGRRIHGVLNALRNFARVDEAPWKQVELSEGLESTLKLLQFRMGDRIKIERDYGDVGPVSCRPDALNQVFMNLLQNAIQAIPEQGRITVRTRREDGDVVISIGDTGVGIAPESRQRIFESGFTRRSKSGGSGLGLALSRKIVTDHGGDITVESEPGHGTTFHIRIPCAQGECEA
jgi:signal transduction histidine kinase